MVMWLVLTVYRQPLILPEMKKNKKRGSIIVRAEEVAAVKGTVRLQLSGHHLDKKDWFGKVCSFQQKNKNI
jgi:hypothetical protein